MTEKEFREKMAGMYGSVPTDTHAAFEHALTHHREAEAQPIRVNKLRFAVVLALVLALLATGAYAIYARYSVTDYMSNTSQTFLDHVITLNETYENDLFTMTVNDLVFDGENFAVAMNIDRRSEDVVYYMRTRVTATCAGEEYMVDVEGWRGPDFLAGGMWPEFGGFYDDPVKAEQEGFGFEGVLMDWDFNLPPAGEPIDWTMTFTVFRPVWEVVEDGFVLRGASMEDELYRRMEEAWQNRQIYMYSGDANSYINYMWDKMGMTEELTWEEMLAETEAFELADVITFHFTTNFDDDVVKEELIGQRYDLGEYAVVIDEMRVSFQRISASMHIEFDREMTLEELEAVDMPTGVSVTCIGENGERDVHDWNTFWLHMDPEDETGPRYELGFSIFTNVDHVTSLTVQGYDRGRIYRDNFKFTVELP